MISLPRHLAPWAAQLALFPEDIALVLGRMVVQLAELIGGWRLDQNGAETPNGYDGVALRGDYDRLLASEWLLLDEIPEEFMRRAVSREHMFLRRAFQGSAAARRCVALFDSGAEQLGAPRIAQIAILIVLGQRAEKLGASFEWGVLQAPVATLNESAGAVQVRQLLRSRCARLVSPEDVGRWIDAINPAPASEIWLVGAKRLEPLAREHGASSLVVSDVLELDAPQRVRVAATPPGGTRVKEAVLTVPEGGAAARLLRDPLMTAASARPKSSIRIDAGSNIIFSQDGRQLWVRGDHGTLIAYYISNSTSAMEQLPSVFTPPEGKTIVAVAPKKWGKSAVVALQDNDSLEICVLTKRGGAVRQILASRICSDEIRPAFSPDAPLRPLAVLDHKHFCFLDAQGAYVEIRDEDWSVSQNFNAPASKAAKSGFVYVYHVIKRTWFTVRVTLDAERKFAQTQHGPETPPPAPDARFFFGCDEPASVAAYSPSKSTGVMWSAGKIHKIDIPRDHSVIGIMPMPPHSAMSPVFMDQTRTRIEIMDAASLKTVLTTTTPIAYAAASDAAGDIACITESGELSVYSRGVGVVLRAALPEAAP